MKYLSIALVIMMLTVWLGYAVSQGYAAIKQRSWERVITFVAALFMGVGAIGFFGTAFVAMGGANWLPASFEMPVGLANGVVTTKDGFFVVPHTPMGRVQVYDSSWKFVRGWNVDASAGTFRLFVTETNHVHVLTARGQMHFEFDLNGNLLAQSTYSNSDTNYSSFWNAGDSYVVPTPLALWVFTSPGFSWAAAVIGLALFAMRDKLVARRKRKVKRAGGGQRLIDRDPDSKPVDGQCRNGKR